MARDEKKMKVYTREIRVSQQRQHIRIDDARVNVLALLWVCLYGVTMHSILTHTTDGTRMRECVRLREMFVWSSDAVI